MQCHLIFVVEYRKRLLISYGNFIKQICYDIVQNSNFSIQEMEIDKDHIHFLISYEPQISITQIVRKLKIITTKRLWKNYEQNLKLYFWKERTFWSDGYFVCSIGNANEDTIKKYIKNQG